MNERIRLLSEQAEKYADDNFRGEPTWSESFESKFAELIVRECAAQAEEESSWPYSSFGKKIKEHFGVED